MGTEGGGMLNEIPWVELTVITVGTFPVAFTVELTVELICLAALSSISLTWCSAVAVCVWVSDF